MKMMNCGLIRTTLLATSILLALTACNDDNTDGSDSTDTGKAQKAVIATVAADFSAGAHAVFSTEAPFSGVTQQSPTVSDITVNCDGEYFYRIERFSGENVTRFHITRPAEALAQLSTRDSSGQETASSNPQGLVFVSDTRAYLLRHGSSKAWIVNPAAKTDAEFKVGELDLSAYNVDGSPNMISGVAVDGKLYIAMQRLKTADFSYAPQDAYVAVIDIATNTEIDTAPGKEGLKGILLPVKNPGELEYDAATGLIFVQGTGRYASFDGSRAPEYTGGIATIDPQNNYATRVVLDDGDATTHPVGLITGMEITSATRGYIVGYAGFKDNGLYSFDPATGKLDVDAAGKPVVVADIKGVGIGGLAHDNQGRLWVSVADDAAPGIKVLDGKDGKVIRERIATTLNPTAITFCNAPEK